jgi:hypothetical protein
VKLTVGAAVVLALVGACAEEAPKYSRGPDVSPSVGEGGSAGESASSPSAPNHAGALGEAGSGEPPSEAGGAPGEAETSTGGAPAQGGAAGEAGEEPTSEAGTGGAEAQCRSDRDCPEELSCNESGVCVECVDDDQCEADGPCSAGNCTANGVCEQRPLDEGQSCDDGTFCNGGETCDGEGTCRAGNEPCPEPTVCDDKLDQCVGCIDGSDCPEQTPTCSAAKLCICTQDEDCAIADECRVGRCDLATGKCRVDNVEAGAPVGAQVTGDCRKRQCNGTGAAVLADDDSDAPTDPGEPCTHPVCQSGEVLEAPRAPGTECGASATECSGADTCDAAGSCRPNHVENGTVLRAETKNECRRRTCDGSGNAVETPVSAVCNDSSFCTGTESCSNSGVCQSSGDPCAGTPKPYCVGSACQACNMDSQCDGLGARSGRCIGVCVECTDATLEADCGMPASDVGCMGGTCYVKCDCSQESCGRPHSELCARL